MVDATQVTSGVPQLSVVIPTLNEDTTLPALLGDLHAQQEITLECIVSDGGSTDGTDVIARQLSSQLIWSAPGRGGQLNAGARAASGAWLLFLHADSRLHDPLLLRRALDRMQSAADADTGLIAGHFALRFVREQPGHDRLFRFLETKTASNRPDTVNGDQGLLIRRTHFETLGGFDASLPFFEDQRIAARIFAHGRWILLPGTLETSARRFESEGHEDRLRLMAIMMAMHAIDLPQYLAQTPQVYALQHQSKRLQLAPYRRLAQQLLFADGISIGLLRLFRAGRYVRRNAWQLALLADLSAGETESRWLDRHDRYLARWLDNPAADALTAVFVAMWFWLWLPLRRGL